MKQYLFLFLSVLATQQTAFAQVDAAQLSLADSLGTEGKYDQAAAIYQTQLAKDSTCFNCYNGLGIIFSIEKKYNQAIQIYSTALRYFHRSFFYQGRADAYFLLEDMEKYCIDADSAIAIYSRVSDNLNSEEKEIKKVLERKRTEICDAGKPSYFIHRGLAALNRQDTQAIKASYEQGIARFPEDAALKNFQGNFYCLVGEDAKARENYQYALSHLDNLKVYLRNSIALTDSVQVDMFISQTWFSLAKIYGSLTIFVELGRNSKYS